MLELVIAIKVARLTYNLPHMDKDLHTMHRADHFLPGMQQPDTSSLSRPRQAIQPQPLQQANRQPLQDSPPSATPTCARQEEAVQKSPPASNQPPEAQPKQAKPKARPIVTEIQLRDDVTIRQLAQQLEVSASQVEQCLLELGEHPSSQEDLLSPENAELAAMSFGKTVTFSQAYLVSSKPA